MSTIQKPDDCIAGPSFIQGSGGREWKYQGQESGDAEGYHAEGEELEPKEKRFLLWVLCGCLAVNLAVFSFIF